MAYVNFSTREILVKIVYYGPGLGGKTTSLQYIYNSLPQTHRGKMISLATDEDRTIYFDFLPVYLGKLQGFTVRLQLYTVPGQVRYNQTRRLVLKGVDGIVFVADLQKHRKFSNIESMQNCEDNLKYYGLKLENIPHVIQYNKIDLPNILTPEELDPLLNKYNVPWFRTCAVTGEGVLDALTAISKMVFEDLKKRGLKSMAPATAMGEEPASAGEFEPDETLEEAETVIEIEEDDEDLIEVIPENEEAVVEDESPSILQFEDDDVALIEPETGEPIPLSDMDTETEQAVEWLEPAGDQEAMNERIEPGERTEWETRELREDEKEAIEETLAPDDQLPTFDVEDFDALDSDFDAEELDIHTVEPDINQTAQEDAFTEVDELSRTIPADETARTPTPERPVPYEDEIQRSIEEQLRNKLGSLPESSPTALKKTTTRIISWFDSMVAAPISSHWQAMIDAHEKQDIQAFRVALKEFVGTIEDHWNKPIDLLLPEAMRPYWQMTFRQIDSAHVWDDSIRIATWFALWAMGWFHWQYYVEKHIL